jgi:hypothetical protein
MLKAENECFQLNIEIYFIRACSRTSLRLAQIFSFLDYHCVGQRWLIHKIGQVVNVAIEDIVCVALFDFNRVLQHIVDQIQSLENEVSLEMFFEVGPGTLLYLNFALLAEADYSLALVLVLFKHVLDQESYLVSFSAVR